MTTTAHEDQYLATPEPVRQPYDTVAILRRNIADMEVALRTQTERAEAAEAELAKLREQKPVAWMREDGNLYLAWQKDLCLPEVRFSPLYASPIPAPAVPAAPDMVITNIVNAEIWVQGGKVYARCANTSEGTGVFVFDGKHFGVTADTWVLMINLLQSAEARHA